MVGRGRADPDRSRGAHTLPQAAGGARRGTGAQMVAEAGQSQGESVGRCERAQEGTGGAISGGDALTHPTPHTLPTGRTTGHAGRQIV